MDDMVVMIEQWAPSGALLILLVISGWLLRLLTGAVERKLGKAAPEGVRILAHGFVRPLILAVQVSLLLAALLLAPLPIPRERILTVAMPVYQAALIALGAWGFWSSSPLCGLLLHDAGKHLDWQGSQTLARFLENSYRVLVALAAVLSVLERLGLPVVSLIAGAGVVGLAITLAAQSTLSNLIAGVTIVLERPFVMGDYIVLSSLEGTVEDISFRSTRLRTPDQMLVTVDNSKLLSDYIQNASNRKTRLWTFNLLLTFDADREHVARFREGLEELLRKDPGVVPDTVQATLDAFGDSGLDISVRLYVSTVALADFRALKNRLNLQMMALLEETGCELAYPSTTIYQAHGAKLKADD